MMVSAGIDQTTSSSRPEYSQSGQWNARVLDARKYQAKAKIAAMVGSTIASMIAIESIRICLSAAAIGPCGSRMFIGQQTPAAPTRRLQERAATGVVPIPPPRNYTAEIMTASREHLTLQLL